MVKTEKMLTYKAFGFSIISQIPLPELEAIDFTNLESVDIEVKFVDLTTKWSEMSDDRNTFVIKSNFVLFQVPDVAIFSVQGGTTILVSPLKENKEDVMRLYILGTCFGAILMQRKVLPLHGSAVVINGKAYAFVGDSGAGKSTIASAFLNQGYQLLSDDVIAISFPLEDSIPYVIPSYPQQKLWKDSLEILGMERNNYQPIYGRENKYCIPISTQFFSEEIPLGGIFELKKTENKEFNIIPIKNLERFYKLYYNTYQKSLIPNLGLLDWHFVTTSKIIETINMYQLERPLTGTSSTQIVAGVLNTISKGELE
ncbi:aldolase [Bacillus sp. ISL-18]|uniref:aldolase n=1 Tax=Bacillus sp. ISL-18 TaxID=2819118 RepID=UPI001BE85265|nr:aldolase [Bacillus sp. ISL-18]MBT2657071.1 aldolase [Bacillus sp. ISL-18]